MALGRIVANMSNDAYHSHPAISRSMLNDIAVSPFYFHAMNLSPNRPAKKDKASFKMGTLLHTTVLEPSEVNVRYAMKPAGMNLTTKAGKEWAESEAEGRIIVSSAEFQAVLDMEKSLKAVPIIASCLASGMAEATLFSTDETTGLDLRIRPDFIHETGEGSVILLDLKTTSDASPRGFAKSVANFRYHVQAAYYTDVYQQATGRRVHDFIFGVVESEYPYAAACYSLSTTAMERGRALYRADLRLLKYCMELDDWPAYGLDLQVLDLPVWALND